MRYLFDALDLLYSSPFRNSEIVVSCAPDAAREEVECDGGHLTLKSAWCLVVDEELRLSEFFLPGLGLFP
jgi:hypothetical protein